MGVGPAGYSAARRVRIEVHGNADRSRSRGPETEDLVIVGASGIEDPRVSLPAASARGSVAEDTPELGGTAYERAAMNRGAGHRGVHCRSRSHADPADGGAVARPSARDQVGADHEFPSLRGFPGRRARRCPGGRSANRRSSLLFDVLSWAPSRALPGGMEGGLFSVLLRMRSRFVAQAFLDPARGTHRVEASTSWHWSWVSSCPTSSSSTSSPRERARSMPDRSRRESRESTSLGRGLRDLLSLARGGGSGAGEREEEVRVELLHLRKARDPALHLDHQVLVDAVLARSVAEPASSSGPRPADR